jgi:hypothetical protein
MPGIHQSPEHFKSRRIQKFTKYLTPVVPVTYVTYSVTPYLIAVDDIWSSHLR